jgi:Ni/Co efflux regulator RcnB
MKTLVSAIVATAFVAASFPASSQTNEAKPGMQNQSSQQTPGTGGTSKPGTPGLAGSQSGQSEAMMVGEGAAVRSPGGMQSSESVGGTDSNASAITKQHDQSGVRGLTGSKSGPTEHPRSK